MVLHLVSCATPDHPSVSLCLQTLRDGDQVVFLADPGQFWPAVDDAMLNKLRLLTANAQCRLYHLHTSDTKLPDCGLAIELIDHGELVDLAVAAPTCQSWY